MTNLFKQSNLIIALRTTNTNEPSALGQLKDVVKRNLASRIFPFTPLFQGCRLATGCRGSEGIGGGGSTRSLTGFLRLNSVTRLLGFVETSWSGRPAGEEFCYPKFFAAAKQTSRYVGKLNVVQWMGILILGFG